MNIRHGDGEIEITVFNRLDITNRNQENIFFCKLNRTLLEMLSKERYANIMDMFSDDLMTYGDWSIGRYLKYLKENGDARYLNFLNKNGDKKYCHFNVPSVSRDEKGLYFYKIGDKIKYVGRCLTNFKDRINKNYGKITPTNCYKTGQSTNCHLNAKVNDNVNVTIGFYIMNNDEEIKKLEKSILVANKDRFEWNIQRS
jgi:hypothetical protein